MSHAAPLAALLVLAATAAHAACGDGRPLTGVNLAGAEFKARQLPGVIGKDYGYPGPAEIGYFAAKGATAIRLPVLWERVQPELMGELDAAQVKAIAAVLAGAAGRDLCVILDIHNYGGYRGNPVGSDEVPEAAFIDLWRRLAQRFPDESRVALDLMNEPKSLPIARWAGVAQATVKALREAGSRHLILVSGGRWSGVHDWFKGGLGGTSNAEAFAGFEDPLARSALEVHQYADANHSGTGASCLPPENFDAMFRELTAWAGSHHQRLFLGEFGVPASPECLAALQRMLDLATDRKVWLGWTYWAGGSRWGGYPLSIAPRGDGSDAPQMAVVEKYLGR